jgi:hypothetical protein
MFTTIFVVVLFVVAFLPFQQQDNRILLFSESRLNGTGRRLESSPRYSPA